MEGIAMRSLLGLVMSLYKDIQELKFSVHALLESFPDRISEQWLDSSEVMKALKIGKRKLQSLRDHGELPFSPADGKFYYKKSDLVKLLESGYGRRKSKP
jgi:hypothetical protein